MLGVSYPQPFADPGSTGSKIFSGVNYASAAAGILDETGQNYVSYFYLLNSITIITWTREQAIIVKALLWHFC